MWLAKGLKLKVRKFWCLICTFVEVTKKQLVGRGGGGGGAFSPHLEKSQPPTPQNGQADSSNSLAVADELFECV